MAIHTEDHRTQIDSIPSKRASHIHRQAADRVHRMEDAFVNWYLIEEGNDLTVVDAGLPSSWTTLEAAVESIGRRLSDIRAVVLTHAHFDHVGFAERARRELQVPVWVHAEEAWLARHPLRYKSERSPLAYLWRPGAMKIVGAMALGGAFFVQGVQDVKTYSENQVLDVPGSPRVVFTPGHTFGHSALHFPQHRAIIAGDALVTLNPYTGKVGPQIVARAATADSQQALASLDRFTEFRADVLFPGHGEPWRGDIGEAVSRARARGAT